MFWRAYLFSLFNAYSTSVKKILNRPGIFSKKPDKHKKKGMKKTGRKNNMSLRNYLLVRDLIREILRNIPRKKELFLTFIIIFGWLNSTRPEVIMTSILDGTLTGGAPKAIELFITGTEDLGNYEIWRSLNGAPFGSGTGAKSALSGIFSNTFVYLVKTDHAGAFVDVFGDEGIFANVIHLGIVGGNGNDGFQIRDTATSSVIDQVWTEDATDSYRDSYWYRRHGTGPDGGWITSSWETPGNDALDGLDEAGLRAAVPFGTYSIAWKGLTSDWNTSSNWSPAMVPSFQTNVIIPDTLVYFPHISNLPDNPATCMNLILVDSSLLTVGPGKSLHVYGNLQLLPDTLMFAPFIRRKEKIIAEEVAIRRIWNKLPGIMQTLGFNQ